MVPERPRRPRRTVLAVPGSSARFIEKARSQPVDAVFLDLEDACAPSEKPAARTRVAAALAEGGWGTTVRTVRVNDVTTPWVLRDVLEVVEAAGEHLDALVLPKVEDASHVQWLDLTLTQLERALGLPVGRIGIEAQVEDARGLLNVAAVAGASPRLESLVFGPADFMASLGVRTLRVGEQPPGYEPGDAYHHVLLSILTAARAYGLQAVDGPYLAVRDPDGLRRAAARTAALGYDGKWVLHPGQVDVVNEVFSPTQEEYDRAEAMLDAYAHALSPEGGAKGSAMHGEEMVDEASRKMALVVSARGRAAGLTRPPAPHSPGVRPSPA